MQSDITDKDLQTDQSETAREVLLEILAEILAEYPDGITINLLANKASEILNKNSALRGTPLKDHLRSISFDLKNAGIVERVQNTKPEQIRLSHGDRAALMDAAGRGSIKIVKRLLEDEVEQEIKDAALITAVINNRTEIARILIVAGADVNAREDLFDRTPLQYVTGRTNKEIERLLRRAGATN